MVKKTKVVNFADRVRLVLREVANILTNILVPLVAVLVFAAELIPGMPYGVIRILKLLEYYFFEAFGTIEKIEDKIEEKFNEKSIK